MSIMIPHAESTTFSIFNYEILLLLLFKCIALTHFSCFNMPVVDWVMVQKTFDNLSKEERRDAVTLVIQNLCKLDKKKCYI